MRIAIIAAILTLQVVQRSAGQSSHGYVFAAPGGVSGGGTAATVHGGLGFEAMFRSRIGIGAEAGYIGFTENIDAGPFTVSPNGYFHFLGDERRGLDPYATAGYTLFFRSRTENLYNFGAGFNWWLGERLGLKFEFRDHVDHERRRALHWWGLRFGLTFRAGR